MKKLILILGVLLVCCLSVTALAAPEYSTSVAGDTLTIKITDSQGKYGDQITLQVLAKDKEIDKVNPYDDNKIVSDFIYVNQGYISEEGSYIVNINMDGNPSGNYGVRINGKEAGEIYFATTTDKNNFLRDLRRLANTGSEAVEAKLDLENPQSITIDMFMLSDEYITKADASIIAEVLTAEIKANPTCLASAESFVASIAHAAHVAALNEGLGSFDAFGKEFELNEKALKVYNEELSKETKTSFASDYYKGKKYITDTEVENAFYDAVVLAYAKEFDSYGDVKTFIENFGKEVGIDVEDIKDLNNKNETELYQYASKLSVSDIESFVKKVNDKAEDLLDGQKSSGGSSGGGGGSIGGGSVGIGGGYAPVVSGDNTVDESLGFIDMENYLWAVESVNALYVKGVVNGVGEGKFEPGRNVNREEMITMLVKAYGIEAGAGDAVFTDVPADSWFAPYVNTAFAKGYVKGAGDGTFGAGSTITRQDAAVMAYNIAKANGITFTPTKDMFPDDSEISDYAKDAVYALKAKGIINGMGDGSFAPKATCTRAEAAVIINKLINQ